MSQSKCYFYYGEEGYLVEEAVETLKKTHNDLDWTPISSEHRWADLQQQLSGISLFGSAQGFVLTDPWFFKSAQDKDPELLTACLDALEQSPHLFVIQTPGKKPDKRKKITSLLIKRSQAEEFQPFKDWEQDKVAGWIQNRVQQFNQSIEKDALSALEELGGTNLRHLASEIDKLIVYCIDKPTISLEDVNAVCSAMSSGVYRYTEALKSRDLNSALRQSQQLIKDGDDPIRLFMLTVSSFRLYIQIFSAMSDGMSFDTAGKVLKKNPFYIKRLWGDLKRVYSFPSLVAAYEMFCDMDHMIKTGQLSGKAALENTLVRILRA